jgi:inosine/xanthosine triphosphatase
VRSSAHALAGVRRVRVGSTNGPKIAAATLALRAYAPAAQIAGAAVESGVSDQPVGFEEIALGARNRALRAFALGDCELAVGYEDGLVELAGLGDGSPELLNLGCAAVTDGSLTSLGLSSGFAYPPELALRAARDRAPIGDLFDALWQQRHGSSGDVASAEREGNIGELSLGALTRTEYARHAIVCALIRFLHPDLYEAHHPGLVAASGAAGMV